MPALESVESGWSVDILFPAQLELLCNLSWRSAGRYQDPGIGTVSICVFRSVRAISLRFPMTRDSSMRLGQVGTYTSFFLSFPPSFAK